MNKAAGKAILQRGKREEHRTSLYLCTEDRAQLARLKAYYEARVGARLSLSLVFSLMLADLSDAPTH